MKKVVGVTCTRIQDFPLSGRVLYQYFCCVLVYVSPLLLRGWLRPFPLHPFQCRSGQFRLLQHIRFFLSSCLHSCYRWWHHNKYQQAGMSRKYYFMKFWNYGKWYYQIIIIIRWQFQGTANKCAIWLIPLTLVPLMPGLSFGIRLCLLVPSIWAFFSSRWNIGIVGELKLLHPLHISYSCMLVFSTSNICMLMLRWQCPVNITTNSHSVFLSINRVLRYFH